VINIRRGDLIALVSAVLVFVFSFLPQLSYSRFDENLWHKLTLLYVFMGPLLALVVGALILLPILGSAVPTPLGIDGHRWTLIGSFLVAFTGVIWMIAIPDGYDAGYGAVLMMIFGLVLFAAAVATEYVSELKVPLTFSKPAGKSTSAPAASTTATSETPPAAPHHHDHGGHDHDGHDHGSHEGHDHP